MASFPGAKVRYPGNRRKLGRGQSVAVPQAVLTVTSSASTVMQIASDTPGVFANPVLATVATLTRVSQSQINPTTLQITFSGAVASHAWTVPSGAIRTNLGGTSPAAAGTF
jgi:hypothetical protein